MEEAIKVLRHAESVLAKKIKGMKDGKPKYAASEKLTELRDGIKCIQFEQRALRGGTNFWSNKPAEDYELGQDKPTTDGWSNKWPTMPVGH